MFVAGADVVTGGNFMDALDNGVLVCHLARVIADKAKHAVESGAARGVSCFSFSVLFPDCHFQNVSRSISCAWRHYLAF